MIPKILSTAILIYCSCFLTHSLMAQKDSPYKTFEEAADAFYGNSMAEIGSVPGVSIVVVKGQKTLYSKGFGYANMKKNIKANSLSNFYIASSTKSFTGLLASLIDQEGIIKLDDPLNKYFPEVNFPKEITADKIQIRDLLTHTSGISNDALGFRVAYTGNHDPKTRLRLINYCTANEVGHGNFSYTNVGYNIYAVILEKVTGKNWKDHLAELIFEPLGMNRTTGYISKAQRANWPMALPYMGLGKENIQEVYLTKQDNTMQAAGGLITNGDDLAHWLKVQMGNGKLKGRRIFPEKLIKANRQYLAKGSTGKSIFEEEAYGLGWQLGTYKGEKAVWHFGGFPGFLTHISYLPEKEIGVAVMVNEGIAGNRLKDLYATFAYDYLLGKISNVDDFQKQSSQLSKQLQQVRNRITQHEEELAKRSWMLSLPFEKYVGTFENEQYGRIEVKMQGGNLFMQYGNLHCIPTPYPKQDQVRVGWIPGSGRVIPFVVEGDEINQLKYMGELFERIGN